MSRKKLKLIDKYPSDFPKNILPSLEDVIKAIYFKHFEQNVNLKVAAEQVACCIEVMWKRAEIPILSTRTIELKVKRHLDKFQSILKYSTSRISYQTKVTQFKVSFSRKSI